jgi:hypothetical protein
VLDRLRGMTLWDLLRYFFRFRTKDGHYGSYELQHVVSALVAQYVLEDKPKGVGLEEIRKRLAESMEMDETAPKVAFVMSFFASEMMPLECEVDVRDGGEPRIRLLRRYHCFPVWDSWQNCRYNIE